MAASQAESVLKAIGVIAGAIILIAILVAVISALVPVTDHLIGDTHDWNPTAGDAETVGSANERPNGFAVAATTETAVRLNTPDAHVRGDLTVPPDDWTVCIVAELAEDANQQASIDIVAIENETVTLRFDDGVWRARHAPSTTAVEIQAARPTNPTPLCARWNTTHLQLDAPGEHDTAPAGSDLTRNVAVGLEGDLDELRVINESLSDQQVEAYLDDPIDPLADANYTGRVMFDASDGTTTTLYYGSGGVALVGDTSLVSGVPDPGLVEGTDYSVDVNPLRVTPLAGGYLDGAPIAYAEWGGTGFGAVIGNLWNVAGSSFILLIVGTVAIAAMGVYRELYSWE